MTYYERITYLVGETNEMNSYLFNNVCKIITFYQEKDKLSNTNTELFLNELETKSSILYSSLNNMSFDEKKHLFSSSKLSIKLQSELLNILIKQSYYNNNFYIEFDNGFSSEDVKIYEKAIDNLNEHIKAIKEINKTIMSLLSTIKTTIYQDM